MFMSSLLSFCFKYTEQERERLHRLFIDHPTIFGYDLQKLGLEAYKQYISQEFTSNCLYSKSDFSPDIIFNDHKNNGNTFNITRIVEISILGEILTTIKQY